MIISILSFAFGIGSVQQLPALPDPKVFLFMAVVLVVSLWLRCRTCLWFLAGFCWAAIFAYIGLADRLPESLEGKVIELSGHVIGIPSNYEQRVRFDLAVQPSNEHLPSKIRLNWYYPTHEVKAGQYWRLSVKLKRPSGSLNPGTFDYERWLFGQGIGATGYVRPNPEPVLLNADAAWFDVSAWRQTLADVLDRHLSTLPSRGVIKALTIGDRQDVESGEWDLLRRTGTVHLMAISGLHIGLVAGLVYWLASIFWIRTGYLFYSPFKVASVCALAAALGYATLAGFSIPTRRALIMLAVALFALMRLRHVSSGHILALALFAVLLADPLAILAPGFWLSFTAVAAILYTVSGRLASEKKWLVAMRIHWLTALALSPLLIGFFQQVSLIAPIANVVAVPVVSLIVVPMSLAAILMLPIAQAPADMLFALADRVLQALDIVLAKLAALPFAYVHLPQPPFYALLLAVPALLLLLAPKGIPARWLGWVMLLPMIFFKPSKLAPGETELILLDVGQGLAAVVRTAHHVLVYDTGPRFDSGFDMGSAVVVPYLYSQGVGHLDTLIVSHGDNDHIGGADSLLRAMPVTSVYSSEPQRLSEYSAGLCKAGQTWIWDDIRFTMLAPEAGFTKAGNDSSCVLKIESNHTSALLTGDIEKPTESLLVEKYGEKLHASLMIAPHHGSKTSSTENFLQAVDPAWVLIPAGYLNRFGFPHEQVLERYRKRNIAWMNSAEHGAITVHFAKSGMTIDAYRVDRGRYWNMQPSNTIK